MTDHVKVFNAAMDEVEDSPLGITLRGALDLETLQFLLVDDYQRQAQSYASQKRIISALEQNKRLPDIEIGMRGQNYSENKEGVYTLKDPTYIIDGLQRISTITEYRKRFPEKTVTIGGTVHFNTSHDWEKERFHALNNYRKRLSPNITLRNLREENRAVLTLYGLTGNDADFPLYDRVSWEQNMRRQDLLSASLLVKVSNKLHSHIIVPMTRRNGTSNRGGTGPEEIAYMLLRRADAIGINIFRNNVRTFFDTVEDIWGVRTIKYKDAAPYIHGTFLQAFARMFNDHTYFWHGTKLVVSRDTKQKMKNFGLDDPNIKKLCGSGGSAAGVLYDYLVEHFNFGRRASGRLKRRLEHHLQEEEVAE